MAKVKNPIVSSKQLLGSIGSTCGRFLARPGHLLLPADQPKSAAVDDCPYYSNLLGLSKKKSTPKFDVYCPIKMTNVQPHPFMSITM